jgi:hypothetical protein
MKSTKVEILVVINPLCVWKNVSPSIFGFPLSTKGLNTCSTRKNNLNGCQCDILSFMIYTHLGVTFMTVK